MFAPLELLLLSSCDRIHDALFEPQPDHRLFIEDADATTRDSAEGEFAVPGNAELAHDEHVERCAQCPRYLVGHRDAAARKAEHDDVGPAGQVAKGAGKPAARAGSRTRVALYAAFAVVALSVVVPVSAAEWVAIMVARNCKDAASCDGGALGTDLEVFPLTVTRKPARTPDWGPPRGSEVC